MRTKTLGNDLAIEPTMERYPQFRDHGSGIAPFFPVQAEASGLYLPFHLFLFFCRIPLLFTVNFAYFLILQWLSLGPLFKKAALWLIIGIPGIWWIDLQIDGVKKGSVTLVMDSILVNTDMRLRASDPLPNIIKLDCHSRAR